ncbi:Retrovirus-related Pol polyprotein from transposon 17.6 [Dictyocoela muelleri]|nr:Retrovirus-related Pol polyprotein from transposon 17.6 [Dictyocoela muelleri]
MNFGLINALFTFQRVMNKICGNYIYKFIFVYIDDIIIFSKSPEEHVGHLKIIFETIKKVNFKLNSEKCHFLKTKINFLGFTVTQNEVNIPEIQKEKIKNWKIPQNKMIFRNS